MNSNKSSSLFSRAARGEKRRDFKLAPVVDAARSATMSGKQPRRRGSIGFTKITVAAFGDGFNRFNAELHDVKVASHAHVDTTATGRIALARGERNEHCMAEAVR